MALYYVNRNRQPNGDHEVHQQGCRYMPLPQNAVPLGDHFGCASAVVRAKQMGYTTANGCATCAPSCHTR